MMKLILIATIIFSLTSSYSQTYISIKTGGNYSLICSKNNHYTNDFNSEFSYEIGANVKINLVRNFDFSFDLDYINYSTFVHSEGFSSSHSRDYSYDLKLRYLSIGLLPEYSIGKKRFLFIIIGPYLAVLTNSKIDGVIEGYGPILPYFEEPISGSANSYFKNIDVGVNSNIGLRLKISSDLNILPQIGYRYSLYDIGDDYFVTYDLPVYIRSVSFIMGLEYKIK